LSSSSTRTWFAGLAENVEGKVLDIGLNFCIVEFPTDDSCFASKTLEEIIANDLKDIKLNDVRIYRVHGASDLILCSIAN
jgi:hypothetical protein